jgi:ferredoxin
MDMESPVVQELLRLAYHPARQRNPMIILIFMRHVWQSIPFKVDNNSLAGSEAGAVSREVPCRSLGNRHFRIIVRERSCDEKHAGLAFAALPIERGENMRIKVDRSICAGHALCAAKAPDLYTLDDDGYSNADGKTVPANRAEQARLGAACCPERAITLVEDGD